MSRQSRVSVTVLCWAVVLVAGATLLVASTWRIAPGGYGRIGALLTFGVLLIESFVPQCVAALLVVAVGCALARRGAAATVAAALLVATGGGWAWSWVRPIPNAGDERGLVVLSANLLFTNPAPERLVAQIEAVNPDVVLLQEFDPVGAGVLADWMRTRFEHEAVWGRPDAFGQAVFSRLPFENDPILHRETGTLGLPQVEFEVTWDGRPVRLLNVHTVPPTGTTNVIRQRRMIRWIGERAEEWLAGPSIDAVVLAGDFNSAWGTGHLREIRAAGLDEAHRATGRGTGATWALARKRLGRSVLGIRLDHVAFGGGLSCLSSGVGEPIGSDHLPVWAEFDWRDPKRNRRPPGDL